MRDLHTKKQGRGGIGGPSTSNGKNNSSQNSLKHGCRSHNALLPGESPEEYEQLWKTWLSRYSPASPADFEFIRLTVDAAWRMQRSERAYQEVEASLHATASPVNWTDDQLRRLLLMQRYKTADANAFHKCVRLLETIQKNDLQIRGISQRQAGYMCDELYKGEDYVNFKSAVERKLAAPVELSTTREDGGCHCTPCLLLWGLRDLRSKLLAEAEAKAEAEAEKPPPDEENQSDPPLAS
jgi:hypothetical protein